LSKHFLDRKVMNPTADAGVTQLPRVSVLIRRNYVDVGINYHGGAILALI
jgi:hypothetical protein